MVFSSACGQESCLATWLVTGGAGQAGGQHGFSRAGRADHQQVVPPGGGNFQRALGPFLSLHLGQAAPADRPVDHAGFSAGDGGAVGQMVDHLAQRGGGDQPARMGQLGEDRDHLLRRADRAMYQAKRDGRNRVSVAH